MKNISLFICVCFTQIVSAQILINDDATDLSSVNSSASLEVRATDQGMIVPRLTTANIEALKTSGNATEGLVVYDDDKNCYFGYQRGVWTELTSCGGTTPPPVTEFNGGDFIFTGFQTFNGDDAYYPVNGTPVSGLPSNAADKLSIVTLVTIPAEQDFYITDNGWKNTNKFRTGEGVMKWHIDTEIPAKTEITFYSPQNKNGGFEWTVSHGSVYDLPESNFNKGPQFSNQGDNVFIYTVNDPTQNVFEVSNLDEIIVGLKLKTSWDSDATSSQTSAIPSNLVDGETALSISNSPDDYNFYFDCSKLSDPDTVAPFTDVELRQVVNNQDNWIPYIDESAAVPSTCNYSSL